MSRKIAKLMDTVSDMTEDQLKDFKIALGMDVKEDVVDETTEVVEEVKEDEVVTDETTDDNKVDDQEVVEDVVDDTTELSVEDKKIAELEAMVKKQEAMMKAFMENKPFGLVKKVTERVEEIDMERWNADAIIGK